MNEYDPLWLIKYSIVQKACSTQSLLAMMATLVKILKEHREINLAEVERLMKMLEDKKVELVKWAKEVNHWSQREANLYA